MLALGCAEESPDPDGGGVILPPKVPIIIDEAPSWSPDGTKIAYYHSGVTSIESGGTEVDSDSVGIWLSGAFGEDPHMVFGGFNLRAEFARTREQIAVAGGGLIFRFTLSGDSLVEPQQLTDSDSNFEPIWSWDGTAIAYRSNAGGRYEIWRMAADGTGKRRMPLDHDGSVVGVDWLPSGDRIVASAYDISALNYDIAVFDTSGPLLRYVARTSQSETRPRVSPTGNEVAFERTGRVIVLSIDGGDVRVVASGGFPAWSPDGTELAYVTNEGPDGVAFTVWVVSVENGARRQVTFGP